MLARDAAKLDGALQGLKEAVPDGDFETGSLDLADLDSVRSAATEIAERYPEIHLLINNAGIMACPPGRTAQGYELQFGTNHLGHFLLSCLLVPALSAAAAETGEARLVSLSSAGHKFADLNFDDPNYNEREYNKWQAYGESKTANVLFTVGLEQRFGESGVHSLAVHPGVIMTELSRHMSQEDLEMLMARGGAEGLKIKTTEQGSATSVWAATSPELEGRGGLYLEDCHIGEAAAPGDDGGVEAYAVDSAIADRLWSLSEELVGETFA